MAPLTADRHLAQRSLLDPHEEEGRRSPQPPAHRFGPSLPLGRPAPQPPRPQPPRPQPPRPRAAAFAGPTLDDLVAGTWDALTVTHAASCLVCGDDLLPRFGSGPHPVAARCRSCGSQLA